MSIPNHLMSIKSSGIYRFVWDKSQIEPQIAETLRVVIGYSDKGPFNTPVLIEKDTDFVNIFGNISKKLERKGIFFHRMALQALAAGPILALNLKKFKDGSNYHVGTLAFDASELGSELTPAETINVQELYDRNRFWTLDVDSLYSNIKNEDKFVSLAMTDVKDASCSIFMVKTVPVAYGITFREWYSNTEEEMPSYIEQIADDMINDYFVKIYVFRGKFTEELCGEGKPFAKYFNVSDGKISIEQDFTDPFGNKSSALDALASDPDSNFISVYEGCLIPYFKDMANNEISIDAVFNSDYNSHKMIMKLNEDLLYSAEDADAVRKHMQYPYPGVNKDGYDYYKREGSDPYSYTKIESTGEDLTAALSQAVEQLSVPDEVTGESDEYIKVKIPTDTSTPKYITGYTYDISEFENFNPLIQNKNYNIQLGIFSVLDTTGEIENGLVTALTNNVDVNYHYIVDTFASFVDDANECKSRLAAIAKKKDNAFAILNFPKIRDFAADKRFKVGGIETGQFDITRIPDNFKLVSETNGASWVGYFTPLIFKDGSAKTYVPSAALVSNKFMEKYSSRQPYYIVAGVNYGMLTYPNMIGPDYSYCRADLDVLEPMGVNAIIYVPRKGTFINSNQTAKQIPVSALSKIHIRELVIYLQDSIEDMLRNYHWELNTSTLRDTIETKADKLLEVVQNNGGVYAFKNKCDEYNNTQEIIDNEMIILDTEIEPARGAGKMIQQLTIHKTGGITSTTK